MCKHFFAAFFAKTKANPRHVSFFLSVFANSVVFLFFFFLSFFFSSSLFQQFKLGKRRERWDNIWEKKKIILFTLLISLPPFLPYLSLSPILFVCFFFFFFSLSFF
eukprot:TRINITY_DN8798_c0_g1_i1.p1 TRINITY_DN8798_c0_g1~~TRINITY_DN8798_c0_g1_i1.p1  ORF type:complete len:106 (+),score=1.07 TRINITY_DN8798_c0_g1_i1:170-487(+)